MEEIDSFFQKYKTIMEFIFIPKAVNSDGVLNKK
jgi:hypothetical protein